MQTRLIVLRERSAPVTVFARRHRFLIGATANRELGIPPLAHAARLAAACGVLLALTALPAHAQPSKPADIEHWWPLNEQLVPTAKDVITGIVSMHVNSPVPVVVGLVNGALSTGGTTLGHVKVLTGLPTLDINLVAHPLGFTVDFWYKCNANLNCYLTFGGSPIVVSKWVAAPSGIGGVGYHIDVDPGGYCWEVGDVNPLLFAGS